MRKVVCIIVTVVSLALFSGRAHAQRYLPGMTGVELRGGFANGSRNPLNYYTGFAVSGYTKRANRWVIGAEYLQKNYGYRNVSLPRAQFTAEGGYYLKFLSDPSKTLFLSIGGSAMAGYETVNWGDRILYDGSRLLVKDAFVYGGAITLELETYVTDRIVLLASVRVHDPVRDRTEIHHQLKITAYEYRRHKGCSHYRFPREIGIRAEKTARG